MLSIGIIGAAGYTAGELIRILLNHPEAEITFAHSNSNSGNYISDVHTDLIGETELKFTSELNFNGIDAIFLCMGHGKSKTFIQEHSIPESVKIIDLSTDFRMKGNHDFIYGLPELNRSEIIKANKIANPGCFATGIQLALLPIAAAQKLNSEVHIQAITGSTGAGQAPSRTSHFSWRSGNVSAYKIFTHQHLAEIGQSFTQLQQSFDSDINFVPVRGNHTRGIFASIYIDCQLTLEDAYELYESYYAQHPFVAISHKNPDLKQVVNTNKAVIYLEKHRSKLVIISLTDNLLKGASGQAVQNMNLMFGLNEKCGLNLKTVAF